MVTRHYQYNLVFLSLPVSVFVLCIAPYRGMLMSLYSAESSFHYVDFARKDDKKPQIRHHTCQETTVTRH